MGYVIVDHCKAVSLNDLPVRAREKKLLGGLVEWVTVNSKREDWGSSDCAVC